jgi:hypothetical protein
MKKTLIMLAVMITLATRVFAGDEKINPAVENAFKSKFPGAVEVEWLAGPTYYKATFTYNDTKLFAIFSDDATLMGIARNISSPQLPYFLQTKLRKSFAHYWISDLYEMSNGEGFAYYVTLEDADNKVVLESKEGRDWTVISIK